ncbi:twin-arginine translocation signal domain-containing protein [Streptomyces microflavus]|uniref:twin-arginine translocation signal domain-containing protein n=1 Tax=Streptomyces microflavus TaxID=1919 RepID=UPI0036979912
MPPISRRSLLRGAAGVGALPLLGAFRYVYDPSTSNGTAGTTCSSVRATATRAPTSSRHATRSVSNSSGTPDMCRVTPWR